MNRIAPLALLLLVIPALAVDGGPDAGIDAGVDAGAVDAGGAPLEPDAGVVETDAGSDPCAPVCDGQLLRFCDGATPASRDCAAEGATCGLLSPAWGADCLLPEGAACEPGYGDDLSACEGASAGIRCCVDEVCTSQSTPGDCRAFAPPRPEVPSAPTDGPITPVDPNTPQSCLNCSQVNLAWIFPFALLRLRRRRS